MPMSVDAFREFHRILYAGEGMLITVTLLKRNDDQQEGTVRAVKLFEVRRSMFTKTGEPIAGEMASAHMAVFHIPRTSLEQAGVQYINAADRIVDYDSPENRPRTWQPESDNVITTKLLQMHICVQCKRVDPPVS